MSQPPPPPWPPGQPQDPQYGGWTEPNPQYYLTPAPAGPPAPPERRGKLIGATAAVLVLAAGGIATYVAVSDTAHHGAASPQAAVRTIVDDLNNSDLVGVLGDLVPAERDAIATPVLDTIAQLKRTDVLNQGADGNNVTGVTISASNLTFAGGTITINDHVQVVQLTGGTLRVTTDLAKVPFTRDFLDAALPNGLGNAHAHTSTIDISRVVAGNGGRPMRIATQQVGDSWYPSLLYTYADNITTALGEQAPAASDRIPAHGAGSPQEAVGEFVTAALNGDVRRVVELSSPEEMAVLHDYGRLLLDRVGSFMPSGLTVSNLQFDTKTVSVGVVLVVPKGLTVTRNGQAVTVTRDGDCYTISAPGQTKQFCAQAFVAGLASGIGRFGPSISARQRQALTDAFSGLTGVGVFTSESGGSWYVDPVRTLLSLGDTVLSALQPGDLLEIVKLFTGH